MPSYVLLTKLTDEGCNTLQDNPERIKEVNKEVEAMGGKVISQYLILGEYDFLNIVEAPDNETIARISMNLAARGTVRFETFPAIEVNTFIDSMK